MTFLLEKENFIVSMCRHPFSAFNAPEKPSLAYVVERACPDGSVTFRAVSAKEAVFGLAVLLNSRTMGTVPVQKTVPYDTVATTISNLLYPPVALFNKASAKGSDALSIDDDRVSETPAKALAVWDAERQSPLMSLPLTARPTFTTTLMCADEWEQLV